MCTSRPCGFSLLELLLFIVVVSVGIVGILSVMHLTTARSADPMVRKQAITMAEAILEEVMLKDLSNPPGGFTETDTTSCSHRTQYDDIGDYACFDGVPSTAVIHGSDTLGASSLAALSAFSATVAVAPSIIVNGVSMTRVTVTVSGQGQNIQMVGYRAL